MPQEGSVTALVLPAVDNDAEVSGSIGDLGLGHESQLTEGGFGSYRIHSTVRPQFEVAVQGTKAAASETSRVNELCWRSNAAVYALGCNDYWTDTNLKTFCDDQAITCTARTLRNRFLPLIKATQKAAGQKVDEKDASRYARALLYLQSKNVGPERAFDFLREKGGIDGCLKLARKAAETPAALIDRTAQLSLDSAAGELQAGDEVATSATEQALLHELRLKGNGTFVCRILCDENGIQAFDIVTDVESNSIATSSIPDSETALRAA